MKNLLLSGLIVIFASTFARAQERYCGVHAAYTVARCYFGNEVTIEDFIDESYVTSILGSNVQDISRSLIDHGIDVKVYHGLSEVGLTVAQKPIILHVASPNQYRAYNHWIVCFEANSQTAVIAEGDGSLEEIPMSILLSRWDGIAIEASPKESETIARDWISIYEIAYWVCWAVFFISLCCCLRFFPKPAFGAMGILVVVIVARHVTLDSGLLSNLDTTRFVLFASSQGSFERISVDEFLAVHDSVLVVDARYSRDFRRGTIPGAVNITTRASFDELRARTASARKLEKAVVVFCSNEECEMADIVATRLAGIGFNKVFILRMGFDGWLRRSH